MPDLDGRDRLLRTLANQITQVQRDISKLSGQTARRRWSIRLQQLRERRNELMEKYDSLRGTGSIKSFAD